MQKVKGESMQTQRKIFTAFLLNLIFSVAELIGGALTGSIAILSDAMHDFGDAVSIGFSYFFERKSKRKPDEKYSYGYARFSVLGGGITGLILLIGALLVLYNAVCRLINPIEIHYDGVLILAVAGLFINLLATYFTHGGHSINQRAVNLHMLEDVFGWAVVLVGALVMKFTRFYLIDPILSIFLAVFILYHAVKGLKEILDIFLLKTPTDIAEIKNHLLGIEGVEDAHHIHIWTTDGESLYATLHIRCKGNFAQVKRAVKEELLEYGIFHATVETEGEEEECLERECALPATKTTCGHHHH